MNLDQIFTPPPGALQFELIPSRSQQAGRPYFWVVPVKPAFACSKGHRTFYEVLDAPSELVQKAARIQHRRVLGTPIVCNCDGRIIE